MNDAEPRMTNLFLQLGLDESEKGIADFIHTHQLPAEVKIGEAPFWSDAQRQFVCEQIKSDGAWALIVDELNQALHSDATKAQMDEQ